MDRSVELALDLKNQGYTAGVVAQKMVVEHGLSQEAADALVGPLYGKTLGGPRNDFLIGLAQLALGFAGVVVLVVNRDHLWVDSSHSLFGYPGRKRGPFAVIALIGICFVWGTKRLLRAAEKRERQAAASRP